MRDRQRATQPEESTESLRAEHSGSAVCSSQNAAQLDSERCTPVAHGKRKRLARARVESAEIIDELLEERWAKGETDFSDRALAERLLDVTESTVCKWRSGDKPMPIAALLCLPLSFGEDLAERLLSARRELAGDRRSIVALGRAVARVDAFAVHGVMSKTDRASFVKAVRNLAAMLGDIADSVEAGE